MVGRTSGTCEGCGQGEGSQARYRRMKKSTVSIDWFLLAGFAGTVAGHGQIGALPGHTWGRLAGYLSSVSPNPNLVEGRESHSPRSAAGVTSAAAPARYVADGQNKRVPGWKDTCALQNAQSVKNTVKMNALDPANLKRNHTFWILQCPGAMRPCPVALAGAFPGRGTGFRHG
jgi:hypothetical protein